MLEAIEFGAVIASAIYGILRAAKKQLDVVGTISIAFAVAFGGGTLRDLCLDRHPLFWIANDHYLWIVFALGIIGAVVPRQIEKIERFLAVPDAIGLGLFSVVGAGYAVQSGSPFFVALILGVVTGTFGGVIGDVICNEIPSLFRPAPLYATCSFLGAAAYLAVSSTTLPEGAAVAAGIGVTVTLRLAAVKWSLQIPVWGGRDAESGESGEGGEGGEGE